VIDWLGWGATAFDKNGKALDANGRFKRFGVATTNQVKGGEFNVVDDINNPKQTDAQKE